MMNPPSRSTFYSRYHSARSKVLYAYPRHIVGTLATAPAFTDISFVYSRVLRTTTLRHSLCSHNNIYGTYFCIMALYFVNIINYCNMALTFVNLHLRAHMLSCGLLRGFTLIDYVARADLVVAFGVHIHQIVADLVASGRVIGNLERHRYKVCGSVGI